MMKLVKKNITQYTIRIEVNNDDELSIKLTDYTDGYGSWEFEIPGRKEMTLKELADICDFIYSEKVLNATDTIRIATKSGDKIYIRGQKSIKDEIMAVIKVTISSEKK